jgi:hypothetical protein
MNRTHFSYNLLSGFALVVFLVIGFANLPDYGMGWDEVTRWESGDKKIEYYLSFFSAGAENKPRAMGGDRYPGLFDMSLGILHRWVGGDRMLLGHGMSLLFGAIGLVATWWIAKAVFGNRAALIALLLLAVYPSFYGHAMINPKDIPFMATYTLGLAFIFAKFRVLSRQGKLPFRDFIIGGILIGFAGATRIPGLVLYPMAAVVCISALGSYHFTADAQQKDSKNPVYLFGGFLLMGLSAFVVVFLFFPRLHTELLYGVSSVASSLHTSAKEIPLLFEGKVMNAGEGPRSYAHWFFLISTPLWMVFLLIIGAVDILKKTCEKKDSESRERTFLVLFALLTAFPWVYVFLANPSLHNGIRHMLWAVPPLIVLMAGGADLLLDWMRRRSPRMSLIPVLVLAGLLALQILKLVQLHPYQYVYFNRLAGNPGSIVNLYEGEYWHTSTRHLLEALPKVVSQNSDLSTGEEPVRVRVSGPLDCAYPFVPDGVVLVDSFEDADYYLANTTFRTDLLAEGEVVYEIRRAGIPIARIKDIRP